MPMPMPGALPSSSEAAAVPTLPFAPPETRRKRSLLQHPAFHYGVAAAITIALMSTGVFNQLSAQLNTPIKEPDTAAESGTRKVSTGNEEKSSVSYKVMEETIRLLDSIHPKPEGGR